ncbi:hypothetical protein ACFYZ2_12550 [Streptomyces sviceus]
MFGIPPEEVAGQGVRAGLRPLRTVAEGADGLGRDACTGTPWRSN